MIELIMVCEGQTEETFVRDVLLPALAAQGVMVQARLIPTSKHGLGGALKRDRVLRYLRNTLHERDDVYVTTFFDLYGLSADFPGRAEAAAIADPLARAQAIEASFRAAVVDVAGCRPDRFLPHLQPHEASASEESGQSVPILLLGLIGSSTCPSQVLPRLLEGSPLYVTEQSLATSKSTRKVRSGSVALWTLCGQPACTTMQKPS